MKSLIKTLVPPFLLSAMLILFLSSQICSQEKLPDTPAGNKAQKLMDLLNGKDKIEPKEFIRQNCSDAFKEARPEAQWGGALAQVMRMSPNAELNKINKSEKNEISFVIQLTANKMYLTVNLWTDETSPFLINNIGIIPGGGPAQGTQQSGTQTAPLKRNVEAKPENIQKVKEYLKEQAKQNKFSGSALIAKDGKVILHETEGFANKRFKVKNKPDTKFNLASIGKMFTSVAILQLIEAGKIGSIDDPIGKYLDIFPKDVSNKVKIRHLLTMTNGWGDYWNNDYFLSHKDRLRKISDYMEFIKNIPLEFEPGTKSIHSNIGYEVAGAIVEKVSGMDYYDYLKEKIFIAAGMNNTDAYNRDSPVENMAEGYTNSNPMDKIGTNYEWENTYLLSPRGTAAGGHYSTIEDMLKFDIALRNGTLLGKKFADFMNNGYRGNIGDPFNSQRLPAAAGGANGASTVMFRDMINGFTIIVLTNYDHPAGVDIGDEIVKILGLR